LDDRRTILKQNARRSVLREESPTGPRLVKRFHSETALRRLGDPARAAREARRLRAALAAGLPVPTVLGLAQHEGASELTLTWIEGARDLRSAWSADAANAQADNRNTPRRVRVGRRELRRLGELLAQTHAAGLLHRDAHGGNVVLDAEGRPWLVDLAAARIGKQPDGAAMRRDLVRLGSDLRDLAPPSARMRITVAWRHALSPALQRLVPDTRTLIEELEPLIRAARRAYVEGRLPVHRRTSSQTVSHADGVERRNAPDPQNDGAARSATGADAGVYSEVTGSLAPAVWDTAVRLELHRVPAPRAVRLEFGPPARVQLERPAGAACATRARALGTLAGTLLDRGLWLANEAGHAVVPRPEVVLGPEVVVGPSTSAARVAVVLGLPLAIEGAPMGVAAWPRLVACDPVDGVRMLRAAADDWRGHLGRRHMRATFCAAFASAWRGTRRERDALLQALRAPLGTDLPRRFHGTRVPTAQPAPAPTAHTSAASSSMPPVPLRRRARARLLGAAVRAAAWMPNGPLVAVGGTAARLAARGRLGALARANVARALGDGLSPVEQTALLRDAAHFAGRQFAEWLRLARPCAPDGPFAARGAWIDDAVELDASIARLDEVLAEGRGALVVTAHLGNWELLCARLRRRGHQGAVVGRVRDRDPSHQWLTAMRRSYGVETIPQDASPRRALAVLAEGGVLGLLADLPTIRLSMVEAPFLGLPAQTPTAPAALARVHGAPLVPIRCIAMDRGRGGYRLLVEEPLALDAALPRRAALLDLTERLNDVYSRWILADPEQWAWHQRRW